MVLYRQNLFSLAIAAIAKAILMRQSYSHVLETGHLLSLLAVHANICLSFIRVVGQILLFSVLISISYAVALSTSLMHSNSVDWKLHGDLY